MSEFLKFEANFNPKQLERQFEDSADFAQNIAEQNERALLVPELEDQDFQEVAAEGLRTEQASTLSGLAEQAEALPYEQVARAGMDVEQRLNKASLELEKAKERMTAEQRRYDDLLQRTVAIAPLSSEAAKELTERKKHEVELREVDEGRTRVAALQAAQVIVERLCDSMGVWPLPNLGNTPGIIKETSQEPGYDVVYEDEIPVPPEPKSYDSLEARVRAFLTPRDPEMRAKIEHHLVDRAGQTVTVDDMITEILPKAVVEILNLRSKEKQGNYARSRFTSMMGPLGAGEKIQGDLNEQGFVLQYGWRTIKKVDRQTGKLVERRKRNRIYRALSISDYNDAMMGIGEQTSQPLNDIELQQGDSWEAVNKMAPAVEEAKEPFAQPPADRPEAKPDGENQTDWRASFQNAVTGAIRGLMSEGLIGQRGESKSSLGIETLVTLALVETHYHQNLVGPHKGEAMDLIRMVARDQLK